MHKTGYILHVNEVDVILTQIAGSDAIPHICHRGFMCTLEHWTYHVLFRLSFYGLPSHTLTFSYNFLSSKI